jgi:hypothetical protein
MKLKATYPPRRDGNYGRIDGVQIEADGTVEIPDAQRGIALVHTGNFTAVGEIPAKQEDNLPEMMVSNGEVSVDLMTLGKDELLAMARDEMGLEVDGRYGEQKLRDAIMAHVSKEAD